eukprot:GHVU01164767.1.p1 GENE.GHVU01164767.1~~GHVU01164767.1.p1  ORF type:complete len:669 (-),score=107.63 GHVU01164767.1:54-2060(-)
MEPARRREAVVAEFIDKFLSFCLTEKCVSVRLAAVTALDCGSFDDILLGSDNGKLSRLRLLLFDEAPGVQARAFALVGRLAQSDISPPSLREALAWRCVDLLQQVVYTQDLETQEEAARLLNALIQSALHTVRTIADRVLGDLLLLTDAHTSATKRVSSITISNVLCAIVGLASVVPPSALKRPVSSILRFLVGIITNPNSRDAPVTTAFYCLGAIVSYSGCVVEPYFLEPAILPAALRALSGTDGVNDSPRRLKEYVMRSLGAMGAVAPRWCHPALDGGVAAGTGGFSDFSGLGGLGFNGVPLGSGHALLAAAAAADAGGGDGRRGCGAGPAGLDDPMSGGRRRLGVAVDDRDMTAHHHVECTGGPPPFPACAQTNNRQCNGGGALSSSVHRRRHMQTVAEVAVARVRRVLLSDGAAGGSSGGAATTDGHRLGQHDERLFTAMVIGSLLKVVVDDSLVLEKRAVAVQATLYAVRSIRQREVASVVMTQLFPLLLRLLCDYPAAAAAGAAGAGSPNHHHDHHHHHHQRFFVNKSPAESQAPLVPTISNYPSTLISASPSSLPTSGPCSSPLRSPVLRCLCEDMGIAKAAVLDDLPAFAACIGSIVDHLAAALRRSVADVIHGLARSLTHTHTYIPIHRPYPPTHSLIHSLAHSLTLSLTRDSAVGVPL